MWLVCNLSQAGLCSPKSYSLLRVASSTLPIPPLEKNPEKLSLAFEPESAAIFCQTMPKKHLAPQCQATEPFTASRYLIVDIGGGTVDISAHSVAGGIEPHIRVIHSPTGNDCGGARVNSGFRDFLGALLQDEAFETFFTSDECANAKKLAYLNKLNHETFEKQKVLFGDKQQIDENGMLSIELQYEFLETYHSKLQEGLSTMGDSVAKFVGQDLRISYNLMAKFFEPVRDGIIQCIKETLEDVDGKIEKIHLVGGFGGCKYLFREIKAKFGDQNYQYVVPCEPAYAVVKGAVLHRLKPNIIEFRKVEATYGIEINSPFIDNLHDLEYRFTDDDGKYMCSSLFATIVERGDLVGGDEVSTNQFCPVYHNQKSMRFNFYCSMEKDVWYVTGKRGKGSRTAEPVKVPKIGTIEIEMPDLRGDKNRTVDITFDFSHTEIQVQAFDRTSKNEVKTVLDFLTSF